MNQLTQTNQNAATPKPMKWYHKLLMHFLLTYSMTITIEEKVVIVFFKHFFGSLFIVDFQRYVKPIVLPPDVKSTTTKSPDKPGIKSGIPW